VSLFAKTHKYHARVIAVVPEGELFHVFEAYGSVRTELGTFSSAELARWLSADFAEKRQSASAESARQALRAAQRNAAAASLDDALASLDLSNLDIKL